MRLLLLSMIFLCGSERAFAHARLVVNGSLPPRNNLANKTGPCGVVRSATSTQLVAGQQLTVQFEEFVEHPGYYRIAFSPANDQGFDQNVLANNIPDQAGSAPHNYSRTITVPNTPCTGCTIQLIQYMTETNPPSLYFSCADVTILPVNVSPTPSPSPTASPTPSASNSPVPAPTPMHCE